MLRVILTIVQVFSCFAIIGLVLLQRGKGAEAGAGFGAGASGTVFGARGAGTALSRATAIFVAIFMINSLLLTYMGTHSATASQPKSILDTAGEKSGATGASNKLGVTTTPAPAATGGSAATVPTPSAPADNGSVAPTPAPTTPVPAAPAAATAPASPASQPAPPPK